MVPEVPKNKFSAKLQRNQQSATKKSFYRRLYQKGRYCMSLFPDNTLNILDSMQPKSIIFLNR